MPYFDWDEWAINFTLDAHRLGSSPEQIHHELYTSGYFRLRLVTVEQCLRLHGHDISITEPVYYPEVNNGIAWNDLADLFTLSAYCTGFSADQICQELLHYGYDVILAQVISSLHAQGIVWVRIC